MHHRHSEWEWHKALANSGDVVITTENKIYSRIFLHYFFLSDLTLAPSRWSSIIFRRILLKSMFIILSLEVVICLFGVIRAHTHTLQDRLVE